MDTLAFLRKILPDAGLYVIARLIAGRFKHTICDSLDEAAAYAAQFDVQGVATYHACAAYRDRSVERRKSDGTTWHQVRTHDNVRAIKSFWMDLDVEPNNPKKYGSQDEAVDGLVAFCDRTGLPVPMVVSSGGGIHVYWVLSLPVSLDVWKRTAEALKQLAAVCEFRADPACTSDAARVLRPVGTWNRKDAANPRPVELIADAEPLDHQAFQNIVIAQLAKAGIKAPELTLRENPTERLNEAFSIQREFPPCSAVKVADRCRQVDQMRSLKGSIPEPLWYATIQLLCHSIEGDPLIHEWSRGYAGYSEDETQRKIEQVRGQALGPTLCTTFDARNPGGCEGCPFAGKISSPAQLGTKVEAAPAPQVEVLTGDGTVQVTLPQPPAPFTRGATGGIYVEDDGVLHKIYDYDLFPTELSFDEHLGFETVRLRHHLPQEGWREFVLQSSLIARPVDFEAKLRDNHVQPLIRNRMSAYADAYIRKLRTETKLRRLFKGMGWKNGNTEFVLGTRLYRKDGVVPAGRSEGASEILDLFKPVGDFQTWRAMTSIFNYPTLEPHAFTLLLAFAAPLLRLDQRQGFTVSLMSRTGHGKSTMGRVLASVYGHPEKTWVARDSTGNAQTEHIGMYQSIPAYVDEITTIKPKDLRDLVYKVTTGKGRESLRRDRTMRPSTDWSTILIASTNDSLQDKLQLEKANPEAESMRLFEFEFPHSEAFLSVCPDIYEAVNENYGLAGAEYIRRLVAERETIVPRIRQAIERTQQEFGMLGKERFWTQAIALALLGGELARSWGLIDFDPNCIKEWARAETRRMRGTLEESIQTATTTLGEYLNEHIGERIVVNKLNSAVAVHRMPTRGLSQRHELDTKEIFVQRSHIKRWLSTNHHNYNEVRKELFAKGILLGMDARKNLGSGTDLTGEYVPCWRIRADHPELSDMVKEET